MTHPTLIKPAAPVAAPLELYASETSGSLSLNDHKHGADRALILGFEGNHESLEIVRKDVASDARFDFAAGASFDFGADGTLTAGFLSKFNTVLLFIDGADFSIEANAAALLQDYVNHGGGVVISTFWGQEGQVPGGINGTGYNPLTHGVQDPYNAASLGEVFDPKHPIMNGVQELSAQEYRGDYAPGLDAGAHLIANWSDGRPLVAVNAMENVAAVTLFPAYDIHPEEGVTGDFARLFANALDFVAGK
jgi:hypothetical protein